MDHILQDYILHFWGYGNLEAPIWFVGMEEGGEVDAPRMNARLTKWINSGKPEVVDMYPTENIEANRWFNKDKPPIQRTWGRLIRSVLHARGQEVTNGTIRRYQRFNLARSEGETCLIELMPLPAKKQSDWPYSGISNLAILKSRQVYMEEICTLRVERLRQLIQKWEPKIVVFYSTTYFKYWRDVVGDNNPWIEYEFFKILNGNNTKYYCIQHPTYFGVTNKIYDMLGHDMAKTLVN